MENIKYCVGQYYLSSRGTIVVEITDIGPGYYGNKWYTTSGGCLGYYKDLDTRLDYWINVVLHGTPISTQQATALINIWKK